MIGNDARLADDVCHQIKLEQEALDDKEVFSEDFKLCCINLMKTLNLSDTKYDDLRWWVEGVLKRGFSLSSMPSARMLKKGEQRDGASQYEIFRNWSKLSPKGRPFPSWRPFSKVPGHQAAPEGWSHLGPPCKDWLRFPDRLGKNEPKKKE